MGLRFNRTSNSVIEKEKGTRSIFQIENGKGTRTFFSFENGKEAKSIFLIKNLEPSNLGEDYSIG